MAGVVKFVTAVFLLLLAVGSLEVEGRAVAEGVISPGGRKLKTLVPEQPLVLSYHGGPVLGSGGEIKVYVYWYGEFSRRQRSIINGFVQAIEMSGARSPSVKSWWKLTASYKDGKGVAVPASVKLAGQTYDGKASLGKNLKESDLEKLVQQALDAGTLPVDAQGMYFVFTSADVLVEGFCMNQCGTHKVLSGKNKLPFAWVGNSAVQCPGMCAWPFAPLPFPGAPTSAPAKSPNGDVGIDGMIINIGSMLAGASTNPYGNAFYQGDALVPLEAATACTGNYGPHSYPGYPGDLLTDKKSGGNFNVFGYKRRRYLVPALVNHATSACAISA